MKTAAELLEELNTLDEHTTIEAKLASELGPSLMETVCAFANEPHLGGGYLLLGVAQAESSFWPVYETVGVSDADQLQQDVASQCASMFNVPIRPRLSVERLGEKTVVVMFVPEAGAHEKPIHFKNQPLPQSARRRIGSTDQRCTDDDLAAFYQDRRGESFDEQIISDGVLDDLDDEAIELYRQLRRDVDAQAEELSWSRMDLLEALGAAKRHAGLLKPTIAGVLLFGTAKALRRLFPMMREVVANAVMHRDYRVHGSIQIIRYANRLEVRNSGFSIKAEERLGQPGSETRNPRIAAVLHDVKFAETKGSGIRVMRELMAERNLSMPLLQSDRTGNSFMAMLLFHHFLSQDDLDWLDTFRRHALNEEEMKAMISAREVGAIDNAAYRDINRDADTLSASKRLRKLCDCGLLEKKGQGPATYYIPTVQALENWPPPSPKKTGIRESRQDSGKPEVRTTRSGGNCVGLEGKSTELEGKSTELSAAPAGDESAPPAEVQRLIEAMGRKGSKEIVFETVVALLKWREMSVTELASYLDRTPKHVRQEYIAPLVQIDLIRPTNPDNPTDPRQRYKATNIRHK